MDQAVSDRAPILITRQRGENVVMISADEWAGMEESMHLITSPANARRLSEAVRVFEAGEDGVLMLRKFALWPTDCERLPSLGRA